MAATRHPGTATEQTAVATAEQGALDKVLDKPIEYIPFLSEQQIQLTPRMVIRFMCKATKSGKRATLEQALHFCMLCKARGLNPWEGDAYIVGYDTADGPEFSLITAHQAFLKRAEIHPEYDGMQSGVVLQRGGDIVEEEGDFYREGDTLLGGWAKVFFKSRTNPVYKRLRLSVFNKGFGRWKIDPAGMIVKCAEADALRSAFPNSLGGMYLEDEMPGKVAGDEALTNGTIIDVQAMELRDKTLAKTAELRDKLNGSDSASTPAEATPSVDEAAEKKAVRKTIRSQFSDFEIEKHTGGRDINALSLAELNDLNNALVESRD